MEGKKGGVREGSGVTGQRKEKVCGEEICQVKRHFSQLFHPVSLKKKEIAARPTGSRGRGSPGGGNEETISARDGQKSW